jgi:hypothetical protein
MTVSQDIFRAALLNAELPVPEGLQDAKGSPAGARFSVYRNNVIVSLSEALATAFPLVRKLLGGDTFGKLAAVYVRAHPPSSPLMMFYGNEFPAFLDSFEPLQHIKYLSTCARLDIAIRQSYHAADAAPPDVSALQDPERAINVRLALAPSARIIRSVWPLYDIWAFNMRPEAPKPRAVAQDVLVARPDYDPQPYLLPVGMSDWLEKLNSGQTLGQATEETLTKHQDFDLAGSLTLALTSQALVDYTTKEIR